MLNLPMFNVSPEQHKLRQSNHIDSGRALKMSITKTNLMDMYNVLVNVPLPDSVCMASNPKWADRTFGAVNTVQKSACLCFVAKEILDHPTYRDYYGTVSMEEIFTEAENKGYRMWKLAHRTTTLNDSYPSLEYFKEVFKKDEDIQNCHTVEEVYQTAGMPVGIGGSMFFIDNLIANISNSQIQVGFHTRLHSIEEIIDNLKAGYPVPVRVNNAIYLNDPSKKEGHYVMLFGFEYGNAIIVDTSHDKSSGVLKIPVWRLFKAMTADDNLICAWNIRIR